MKKVSNGNWVLWLGAVAALATTAIGLVVYFVVDKQAGGSSGGHPNVGSSIMGVPIPEPFDGSKEHSTYMGVHTARFRPAGDMAYHYGRPSGDPKYPHARD